MAPWAVVSAQPFGRLNEGKRRLVHTHTQPCLRPGMCLVSLAFWASARSAREDAFVHLKGRLQPACLEKPERGWGRAVCLSVAGTANEASLADLISYGTQSHQVSSLPNYAGTKVF